MSKLTPKKQAQFLEVLAEGGTVKAAAFTVGITRQSLYQARDANPEFRAAWDAAIEDGTEVLEAEAFRRAVKGVERPIYSKGEIVDTVHEYSDTLLIFLLKSRDPKKYRDNLKITLVTEDDIKKAAEERGLDPAEVASLAEQIANGKA